MSLLFYGLFEFFIVLLYSFSVLSLRIGKYNFDNLQIISFFNLLLTNIFPPFLNQPHHILLTNLKRKSPQNDGIITGTINNLITLLF